MPCLRSHSELVQETQTFACGSLCCIGLLLLGFVADTQIAS